jgi:hypothetical protein
MRPISYRIGYQGIKPNINSVEIHPQLGIHPVDGALVGCWFTEKYLPEYNKTPKPASIYIQNARIGF